MNHSQPLDAVLTDRTLERSHLRSDQDGPDWDAAGRLASLRWLVPYRRPFIVGLHLLLIAAAGQLALWLRFDGHVPPNEWIAFRQMLPWLIFLRGFTFLPFGVYQGLWRYTGLWELQRIAAAVLWSSLCAYLLAHWWLGGNVYPLSIAVIDTLTLISLIGSVRLAGRVTIPGSSLSGKRRVLVVGAGDAGETIVRAMQRRGEEEVVGFVDDDPDKAGQHIHGVAVLGTRGALAQIVRDERPHEVLIAVPTAESSMLQQIVQTLRPFNVRITKLPNLQDISHGAPVTDIRNVSIEDLMARAPVDLDDRPVRQMVQGRRVLVTGAGGSIGSELCRQIAALKPASLVLFERYENNLFAIATELVDGDAAAFVHPVIGDITDRARLEAVMAEHRPEIVFHAAAHKHVPLMEHNVCEAVKNNVIGSRLVIEAAARHRVHRFILISSDKAVNPTSIMGATKRIAELILQMHTTRTTQFSTVRFGNVLGSNGSVVPRFLEQIRAGGPVTITHPEIRRYFMLIPEAVQLVLHAAALRRPGMVYVLDMGEQIKLVDLARNLIRLAGFAPDDIAIRYIGLRPGEKLFEELIGPHETARPAATEKVLEVSPLRLPDPDTLARQIATLEQCALDGAGQSVIAQIGEIVPEFSPPYPEPKPAPVSMPVRAALRPVLAPRSATGRQACPVCGSNRLTRSRTKSLPEQIHRSLTAKRLHRCAKCGWRGWAVPSIPASKAWPIQPLDVPFVDLSAIDRDVRLASSRKGGGS